MKHLLEVADLCVAYSTPQGQRVIAVAGVSFSVDHAEILGVLGESGSGKSTLAAAVPGILHTNGRIERGAIRFEGQDLTRATPAEIQKIRGARIATIFQEPNLALHPCLCISEQVANVLAAHSTASRSSIREETLRVLKTLFPEDAIRIANAYPHQLSGGQRARALVAQAIICQPALVIADEPTASLDPMTQLEMIALFRSLRQERSLSMILITHNPLLLAGLADRVLVLYAGRIAEIGPAETVLRSPHHPYTRDLLQCVPPLFHQGAADKLPVIPGDSPSTNALEKCAFEGRCSDRMDVCSAREPNAIALTEVHNVSCFKYGG